MVGPTLQPTLWQILLRFMVHPVAMASDIEKMYRQVLIHEQDRDLQRIFWRSKTTEPLLEYQLLTITYGMASAPSTAVKAL